MATPIQTFYKDKTIFLTGGSGFLGKVVIEKLLRTTEVKRIYVLIRPKGHQTGLDRIESWKQDALFSLLLETDANAFERIVPINGDCRELALGISKADRELLKKGVQLVFHCAATVQFTEKLHSALDINTRSVRNMMQLAKEMEQLEAYVHVSTAFSSCVERHIDELYYPEYLNCSVDKVLTLREQLSDEFIDNMTGPLLGRFPNTYTYTKALAEQLIETESEELPICVFRPGIIVASYKEPVEGWIDNLYGPISVLFGVAMGIIRITFLNTEINANIVPVDYCANMMLAAAWQLSKDHPDDRDRPPPIYNFVSNDQNVLSWREFCRKSMRLGNVFPLEQMKWFPFICYTTSLRIFHIIAFFFHIIPGFFMDLMLRAQNKRPRMMNLYRKIHKGIENIAPFVDTDWHIESKNVDRLWQGLSKEDQRLYMFDVSLLNWNDYFLKFIGGMRLYLAKEDNGEESIKRGHRIRARFLKLHILLMLLLAVSCLCLVKYLFGCISYTFSNGFNK